MHTMKLKRMLNQLARAEVVFYLLPAFMILLFAGTIAQKYMGLYRAHDMFFSSFILWLGPIPLPGSFTILGIFTLSLLLKFLFASTWSFKKSGIILSHLGVLIILIGGLITAITAKEGFMILPEGSSSPYLYDYNQRELFIFKNDALASRIPFEGLQDKLKTATPFQITIKGRCTNCEIQKREKLTNQKSMAQFMELKQKAEEKEPEQNFPGITLEISKARTKGENGTYIAFEGMPEPIEIRNGQDRYKIMFGKQQRRLPFSISLIDFVKIDYPGTDKAQSYHSDVTIEDGTLEWPVRIEMNKPLRYKGYTFYQSSFVEGDGVQATILAVVENQGLAFPYFGAVLMALGLLIHIVLRPKSSES